MCSLESTEDRFHGHFLKAYVRKTTEYQKRNLTSTYTSNQTGAIATLLAGSLWALTVVGASVMKEDVTFLAVLDIIAWALLPFYIKRVRWSFVVGIIPPIIGLVGLVAMPGTPPWYTFSSPVYDFSFVVLYLVGLALIYFSYSAFKEL